MVNVPMDSNADTGMETKETTVPTTCCGEQFWKTLKTVVVME
jgi:hypothetical protein